MTLVFLQFVCFRFLFIFGISQSPLKSERLRSVLRLNCQYNSVSVCVCVCERLCVCVIRYSCSVQTQLLSVTNWNYFRYRQTDRRTDGHRQIRGAHISLLFRTISGSVLDWPGSAYDLCLSVYLSVSVYVSVCLRCCEDDTVMCHYQSLKADLDNYGR